MRAFAVRKKSGTESNLRPFWHAQREKRVVLKNNFRVSWLIVTRAESITICTPVPLCEQRRIGESTVYLAEVLDFWRILIYIV